MNIRQKACMLTLLTFSNNPDCVNYNLENRNKVIIFFLQVLLFHCDYFTNGADQKA